MNIIEYPVDKLPEYLDIPSSKALNWRKPGLRRQSNIRPTSQRCAASGDATCGSFSAISIGFSENMELLVP